MNLAIRDIRRHTLRFVLTCIGLGLLLAVVMAMSGIYRGLVADATKVVDAVSADIWVVQRDTRGPFAESSRVPEDLDRAIAAIRDVRAATPVSFQYVQAAVGTRVVRLFLIGHAIDSFVTPSRIVAGRGLTRSSDEIVVDRASAVPLGASVRLGLDDFTVVGLTAGMVSPAGDPVAFVSLPDAQRIQFVPDNDAVRNARARVEAGYAALSRMNPLLRARATRQAIEAAERPHVVNAIVAQLRAPGGAGDVVEAIRRWQRYEAYSAEGQRAVLLEGFIEKSQRQLWLFRAILVAVSGVIVALIIYTLTVDKLREIATLKIIGAADRTIAAMILQQALLLGVIGFAIGYVLISNTYARFPRTVLVQAWDMAALFAIVVAISVAASVLGIRRALKVDPGTALLGG